MKLFKILSKENKMKRGIVEIVDTKSLVFENILLRKIDKVVEFSKIYDFVEDLHCKNNGRPSADPVALFKMVMIRRLFGIQLLGRIEF